jgi:hypothetical protein
MKPRITVLTLGVENLERSLLFMVVVGLQLQLALASQRVSNWSRSSPKSCRCLDVPLVSYLVAPSLECSSLARAGAGKVRYRHGR